MISCRCPGCRAPFDIDNTFAGKKIECGNCGTRFIVNSPSQDDSVNKARKWYYAKANQQQGPFTEEIILQMISSREITPDTLVWMKDFQEWTAVRDVAILIRNPNEPPPLPKQKSVDSLPQGSSIENVGISSTTPVSAPQVRPWVRFWARMVDYALFAVFAGVALSYICPTATRFPSLILLFLAYIFVEALMLSSWGSTPGKALLKVKVRMHDGTKLLYFDALRRAFRVLWQGQGLCIPIVSLIANFCAYRRLRRHGETAWDHNGKSIVSHQKIGTYRRIMATTILTLVVIVWAPAFLICAPRDSVSKQLPPKDEPQQISETREDNTLKFRKAAELGDAEAQFIVGVASKDQAESAKWFRKAAEQGVAIAQQGLGNCYAKGEGVEKDDAEAVKWYRKAAEQFRKAAELGDAASIRYAISPMFFSMCGDDSVKAVKMCRESADSCDKKAQEVLEHKSSSAATTISTNNVLNGASDKDARNDESKKFADLKASEPSDAKGQYALGDCYHEGKGVVKDDTEAVKWYRKAAEQGYAQAQYNLGYCYYGGTGVTEDKTEATKWFQRAIPQFLQLAEKGDPEAQCGLGWCYAFGLGTEKDNTEAVKWFQKAADQGNAEAQYSLGKHYYFGFGVEKNQEEAVKWFRKSAENGYAKGQFELGDCYYLGIGVKKDPVETVKWTRKAAEQGLAKGQAALGACYYAGLGVAKDPVVAVQWIRKSAEQGFPKGQAALGGFYVRGEGVTLDFVEGVKWFRKAAGQGDAEAQYCLGLFCASGVGTTKDKAEAAKWLRKAADQGWRDAQTALEKLE